MHRFAVAICFIAAPIGAQQPVAAQPPAVDTTCTYRTCALSILPNLYGLAVVRGASGQQVANLHFFWPRDITPALRGNDTTAVGADSAAAHAYRAVTLRTVGAGFTDIGAVVAAIAFIRALGAGRLSRRDQILAGTGIGALAVSVPLQFAADGELSRAVWWHNIRFAR